MKDGDFTNNLCNELVPYGQSQRLINPYLHGQGRISLWPVMTTLRGTLPFDYGCHRSRQVRKFPVTPSPWKPNAPYWSRETTIRWHLYLLWASMSVLGQWFERNHQTETTIAIQALNCSYPKSNYVYLLSRYIYEHVNTFNEAYWIQRERYLKSIACQADHPYQAEHVHHTRFTFVQ